MKVTITEPEPEFNPITVQITLETQEELDRLFAVTNHTAIQSIGGLYTLWQSLNACTALSHNYSKYHEELVGLMK